MSFVTPGVSNFEAMVRRRKNQGRPPQAGGQRPPLDAAPESAQGNVPVGQNTRPKQYTNPFVDDALGQHASGYWLNQENPGMQSVLDRMSRESNSAAADMLSMLDARSEGYGQFGSSNYQNLLQSGMADIQGRLAEAQGGVIYGAYNDERNRMMDALGLANQRDLASWNDLTSRYGIDSSERTANASYNAQLEAARLSHELGIAGLAEQGRQYDLGLGYSYDQLAQGEDLAYLNAALQGAGMLGQQGLAGDQQLLGALGMGLSDDQNSLGVMAALGQGFGQQQLGALGAIPGFTQADYYGLGMGLDASQQADQQAAHAAAQAQQAAMYNNQLQNAYNQQAWQHSLNGGNDALRDQLALTLPLANLWSTQHTQGMQAPNTYVNPGQGPVAGGILGALGGILAGGGFGGGGG